MNKALLLLVPLILSVTACTKGHSDAPADPALSTSYPAPLPTADQMAQAALEGDAEVIRDALNRGYEVDTRDEEGRTALMYASFNGHTDLAMQLIRAGAVVNAQDNSGSTALMFAASGPFSKTVQLLIDHGANVNQADRNEHWTALMWAAAEGQSDNVRLLLRHGADPSLKEADGDTAESFAAMRGHTAVVKMLQAASGSK